MSFKKFIIFIIEFILLFLLFLNTSSYATNNVHLDISAQSAILINSSTGQILYSKNEKEQRYPASTTKILTAIIAIEKCSLDEKVIASYDAIMSVPSGYSNAEIRVGEALTVKELLEVFLIHSANEAGFILAEHISGSISAFATLMNEKVSEIGCNNTHFTNPSGLHDKNHYSTAYDLSLIAQYCMQNSTFRNIVSMRSCTIAPTTKHEKRYFLNTNDMLNPKSKYYNEYVIGIKTGFTSQAKNCLIAGYKKNNTELISVVLGSSKSASNNSNSKFADTQILFDYGVNNFSNKTIASKEQILTQIKIEHATPDTQSLDLILQDDINVFVFNSTDLSALEPKIKLNENLSAPIAENAILGTVTYNIDGISYTGNLVASHSVEGSIFLEIILKLVFAIIILFIAYELMYSKKKKKPRGKYLYGRVKY
jgi:D-alanyl-D-alanine carboxypeptidase (penicillin-binding protein 5/6)